MTVPLGMTPGKPFAMPGLASSSELVAGALALTARLEYSIPPQSRPDLAVHATAALRQFYETLSSLPYLRPYAGDMKKQRAQLIREERRRRLLSPASSEDFESTLRWMVENGDEADLDLLLPVMARPPYESETIGRLYELAIQAICSRIYPQAVILHTWGPALRAQAGLLHEGLVAMPVKDNAWFRDAPVLVHLEDAGAFAADAEANPLPDGRLPRAVLWVPDGQPVPAELWSYFDAAIAAGDWQALRDLLACPRQLQSAEAVEDLPASFLAGLDRLPVDLHATTLPLPAAVTEHLSGCRQCRRAFELALMERLQLRRRLACPSAAALAALARGQPQKPGVAEHVTACTSCQAQVAVLKTGL